MDPTVVNTVSKYRLSDEKLICASGLELKESFLHDKKKKKQTGSISKSNLFIEYKNTNNALGMKASVQYIC